jgi:serine protease Do
MRRMAYLAPLAVVVLLPVSTRSQERNRFADVLALQEAVHQSIERAEPAIACILVSRSDKYRLYTPAEPKSPGKLGRFDMRSATLGVDRDSDEYKAIARLDLSDPNNVPESYGSGVVLDAKNGLVLTMAHVIRNATKIYVRLSGGRGSWADIHASDPRSDLAVLRLIDRVPNLKALTLGDGSKLRKGDFLLSLSNPFAAGVRDGSPSASWGIVSNLRRRATGVLSDVLPAERNATVPLYCFNTLIQTDTRLNIGCSGGALLNLQGELVGLSSSLAGIAGGETPGGYGVPIDDGVRRIINVLLRGEEVEYGFLGVYLMRSDQAPEGFVRITGLVPGGPAARGDIHGPQARSLRFQGGFGDEPGDLILSIDGVPVRNNDDLFLTVGMHLAGSTVRVEVADKPEGPRRICSVTLAKFPSLGPLVASKRPAARAGLYVDWTSTVVVPFLRRAQPIPEGVVIREVVSDSPASKAQLRPEMIIAKVGGRRVTNPAEFYRRMESVRGPVELTLTTLEGGENRVTINVN